MTIERFSDRLAAYLENQSAVESLGDGGMPRFPWPEAGILALCPRLVAPTRNGRAVRQSSSWAARTVTVSMNSSTIWSTTRSAGRTVLIEPMTCPTK